MTEPVEIRVVEVCAGSWIVQFTGGLGGWTTLGDAFATESEARAFEQDQLDSADFGDEE